ncbi:MAG TPA: hypothetical protein VL171_01370 [Verrucomicrobiae bacterium]|nr:hypothetical protein [Verrucomicrobiae bacterium]
MRIQFNCFPALAWALFLIAPLETVRGGQYTNFTVAIYTPVNVVRELGDPATLSNQWQLISSQLKVDKVYLEVQRDHDLASDDTIESVKKFFLDRGIKVAGGMALSDGSVGGQFRSFCYTDPADREFIKKAAELAARHFDEVIQDDFFFVATKYDSDIAAKGHRSWTQFRLDLMDDAAENLLIKPAKAVNPKVKMVIKFPNWYEHFQGLGYDLEKEPKLFDGIYTGTETRDSELTDQNLQPYESYLILRYFDNIAPGRNGGGWVDTFSVRYLDRYVEQLWNTVFAKAPEMMLFNWAALAQEIRSGDRAAWEHLHTSLDYNQMLQSYDSNPPAGAPPEPTMARVAGCALEQADQFLGKLGKPIGIASYRPDHAWGEDFLHNYFGMIGIPIDLYPTFPTNANLVLLTEDAAFDPEIVAKIKGQLTAGKTVVITSGLLHALQGKGIEDIVELEYTDCKIRATQYLSGFGPGSGSALDDENAGILFPDIRFLTNDSWPIVRALANGHGYPLMLLNRYSRGLLYVWTIPDNFNDLYRLPVSVTSTIKDYVTTGFPVRLDGPSQVALFAYDNNTCIVENYLPTEADVKVSWLGEFTKLRNLVTGEIVNGQPPEQAPGGRRGFRGRARERRVTFYAHLLPHSYGAFAADR